MVSYAKVMIGTWAALLVLLCVKQNQIAHAIATFLFTISVLPSPHADARLLLPLAFLSERLLGGMTSLGYSPLPFLCAGFLAFIQTADTRWEQYIFSIVAVGALGVYTEGIKLIGSTTAYLVVGSWVYSAMKPSCGVREASLLSGLCGFFVFDAIVNRNLHNLDKTVAMNVSSFPYVAGRAMILAAIVVADLMGLGSSSAKNNSSSSSSSKNAKTSLFGQQWWQHCQTDIKYLISVISTLFAAYIYLWWEFQESPIVWLLAYLVSSPMRLRALLCWFTGIPLGIGLIQLFGDRFSKPIRRKLFHLLALVAFLPVCLYDAEYLSFAVLVATGLGALLEVARINHVRGTATLSRFFASHIDERDSGIVRTHLYLLLGQSLSVSIYMRQQMLHSFPLAPVVLFSIFIVPGLIVLGVMDAMAAVVGTITYHRRLAAATKKKRGEPTARERQLLAQLAKPHRLSYYLCEGHYIQKLFPLSENPSLAHKTVEGTVAGLAAAVVVWLCVSYGIIGVPVFRAVQPSLLALVAASLFEAVTEGVDNLELPIFTMGVVETSVLMLKLLF